MPDVGATFNLLTNANYPAVDDTVIEADPHNAMLEDIAQGLTDRVTRDGAGSMSGNLNMGTHKLTNLAAGSANGDSVRYEQVQLASAVATAWESLSWANGKIGAATGASSFALFDYTTAGMAALKFVDPNADKLLYFRDSDATWQPVTLAAQFTFSGGTLGVTGLGAATTSAAVASAISDETGSGALVFGTSPSLASPTISGTVAGSHAYSGLATFAPPNSSRVGVEIASTTGGFASFVDSGAKAWAVGVADGVTGLSIYEDRDSGTAGTERARFLAGGGMTLGGVSVPTISSADTLSNKTLSSPTLSGTVAGAATFSGQITYTVAGIPVVLNNTGGGSQMAELRQSGTLRASIAADSSTFTIFDSSTNSRLALTLANGNLAVGAVTSGGVAVPTISSTDTLTNKTLSSPTLSGTVAGNPSTNGAWTNTGDWLHGNGSKLQFDSHGNGPTGYSYIRNTTSSPYDYMDFASQAPLGGWSSGIRLYTNNNAGALSLGMALLNNGGTPSLDVSTSAFTFNSVPVVTTTGAQTLSNKTLSATTISGTVAGSPAFSAVPSFQGASANSPRVSLEIASTSGGFLSMVDTGSKAWGVGIVDGASYLSIFEDKDQGTTGTERARFLAGGGMTLGGVNVVTTSSTDTLTNKTINGGSISAQVQTSAETSGTLSSASSNKTVNASADVTINDGVHAAGDRIEIYAGASARSIIQDTGMTLRLDGTSTTGTRSLTARGRASVYFVSNSEAIVSGMGVT